MHKKLGSYKEDIDILHEQNFEINQELDETKCKNVRLCNDIKKITETLQEGNEHKNKKMNNNVQALVELSKLKTEYIELTKAYDRLGIKYEKVKEEWKKQGVTRPSQEQQYVRFKL